MSLFIENSHESTNISEQLKKDGNLREDLYVREFDDQPRSWQDVRNTLKRALNPSLKDASPETLREELRESEIRTDKVLETGKSK